MTKPPSNDDKPKDISFRVFFIHCISNLEISLNIEKKIYLFYFLLFINRFILFDAKTCILVQTCDGLSY